MHDSTIINIKILKIVYKYFYNIIFYEIILATDHSKEIKIYVDAAHVNHENSKSTKNYIIFYIKDSII